MYVGRGGEITWYSGIGDEGGKIAECSEISNEGGKIVKTDIGSGGVGGDTR